MLNAQHREMVSSLQPLYSVFVDALEFRDLAYETITSIASSQVHLDIVSHVYMFVCRAAPIPDFTDTSSTKYWC